MVKIKQFIHHPQLGSDSDSDCEEENTEKMEQFILHPQIEVSTHRDEFGASPQTTTTAMTQPSYNIIYHHITEKIHSLMTIDNARTITI